MTKTVTTLVAVATIGLAFGTPIAGAAAKEDPKDVEARTGHHSRDVCDKNVAKDRAQCLAKVIDRGTSDPTPLVSTAPYGASPATIKTAYGFPTSTTAGAGTTIAIVDAYDQPSVQTDLQSFSQTYGLPCNGCLTKVNQTGGTTYPTVDASWALEISLDVQWAHAVAPGANILLVEATTNNWSDLMAAVDYAKTRASYVTMSWGGPELTSLTSYDSHLTTPGVSFFAAAGDSGLGANYPSVSPNVVSVGGTTLNNLGSTSMTETAWASGGGGCSALESATAAQRAFSEYGQAGCIPGARATPDVSLNADPASGFSVYNSTPAAFGGNWYNVGGTSASAPIWAARSAVDGGVMNSARIYGATAPSLRDVTSGNNGAPARVGYDLASGRGSWLDGTGSTTTTTVAPTTTTTIAPTTTTTTVPPSGTMRTETFSGSLKRSASRIYSVATGPGQMTSALSFSGSATSMTVTVKASNGVVVGSLTGPTIVSLPVSVAAGTYTIEVGQAAGGNTSYTLNVIHPVP